jgi:hypothetical protein
MENGKMAAAIAVLPPYLVGAAIGYLLYRFIKPASGCEKSLPNHLRRYLAFAAVASIYTSVSPFFRHSFDMAAATALAGTAMIFCIFGLVGLVTWYLGSKTRNGLNDTTVRGNANHEQSPAQNQPFATTYEKNELGPLGKKTDLASNPDSDAIYAAVAEEIESGNTEKGLWTRLYAECDGDEKRTKVQYIKQRAANLLATDKAATSPEPMISERAADNGFGSLTTEQIEYLDRPILAVKYLQKYTVSKDQLAEACSKKRLKSAWDRDVLWVQDLPMQESNQFGYQINYLGLKVFGAFALFIAIVYVVIMFGVGQTKTPDFAPAALVTPKPSDSGVNTAHEILGQWIASVPGAQLAFSATHLNSGQLYVEASVSTARCLGEISGVAQQSGSTLTIFDKSGGQDSCTIDAKVINGNLHLTEDICPWHGFECSFSGVLVRK